MDMVNHSNNKKIFREKWAFLPHLSPAIQLLSMKVFSFRQVSIFYENSSLLLGSVEIWLPESGTQVGKGLKVSSVR